MDYDPNLSKLYYKALENYCGAVLVTDGKGVILYANQYVISTSMPELGNSVIGMSLSKIVEMGYLTDTPTMEAIKTKKITLRSVDSVTLLNKRLSHVTIAIPVQDETEKIEYVISLSMDELLTESLFQTIELHKSQLRYLLDKVQNGYTNSGFVAESPQMKCILSYCERISAADAPVIIYGESGVGKEVLANHIYKTSRRNDKIFIPVNCAAIPESLIESEFLGYERGAFTGALSAGKAGLFELANGGTLFLDEIGELPLSVQGTLLRALESGEIRRIGGQKIITVDVRIIAATNRNLLKMIEEGKFREDLYYRLNILPITIPPLRERKADLLALSNLFLQQYNKKYGLKKIFASETLNQMAAYPWPGNVRELKNKINQMFLTSRSSFLYFDENIFTPFDLTRPAQDNSAMQKKSDYNGTLKEVVRKFEATYIEEILNQENFDLKESAKVLGIHISSLYKKLSDYHISFKR